MDHRIFDEGYVLWARDLRQKSVWEVKRLLVDYCFVVVKAEHFYSVCAEQAAVIVSTDGEISDLSSSKPTDKCFVLILKLPLDQHWLLSCWEQEPILCKSERVDGVSVPLRKGLNDQLRSILVGHKVVQDVDLATLVTNCKLFAVVRDWETYQLGLTADDLGLFSAEAVSNNSFALDVDQLVLKDQLLRDQNWQLLADSFTLFKGRKVVNTEFHIAVYEKFSFLECCMPNFWLLA